MQSLLEVFFSSLLGLEISYETIRRWVLKFGCTFARNIRHRRPRPHEQWHLDEMIVMIAGKRQYL